MTLGEDFLNLASELITKGSFGSLVNYVAVTREEDPETGVVTVTEADPAPIRVAFSEPGETTLFSQETLAVADAIVIMPGNAMAAAPALLDKIEVTTGSWMKITEVKRIYGPGESGPPVVVAYQLALVT